MINNSFYKKERMNAILVKLDCNLEDCGISCELTIKELFDKNNHSIGENKGEN